MHLDCYISITGPLVFVRGKPLDMPHTWLFGKNVILFVAFTWERTHHLQAHIKVLICYIFILTWFLPHVATLLVSVQNGCSLTDLLHRNVSSEIGQQKLNVFKSKNVFGN